MSATDSGSENLAEVARRRRQARQANGEQESGGVNALLSKLRIEQERHRQNVVAKTARGHIKDDRTHARYLYTSAPAKHPVSDSFSFHTDQIDPTAPLPTPPPRRTVNSRRRTPGPSAPASWATITSFDTRDAAQTSSNHRQLSEMERREEESQRRWMMYELWYEKVLKAYVDDEKMPYELRRRSRREGRREKQCDSSTQRTSQADLVEPPTLVNVTLKLLSRYMDPLPPDTTSTPSAQTSANWTHTASAESTSWLNSSDIKQFLGAQSRLAIMVHGVWEGNASWRGVKDIASSLDTEHSEDVNVDLHNLSKGQDGGSEGEGEDWDASSASSDSLSATQPCIPHLPILDFSFCQFDPSGPSRQHSTLSMTRNQRDLSRYLRSSSVRSTVEAISFAGSSLTVRQAVEMLAVGNEGKGAGHWVKLKNLSLAGLRSGTVDDLKVGLLKLARYAGGIEFLDLSGIELFPQKDWTWRTLLTTLLGRSASNKFDYRVLRLIGLKDCFTLAEATHQVAPVAMSRGRDGKGVGGKEDGRVGSEVLSEHDAEVRRLTRSFGRPSWVEVIVR